MSGSRVSALSITVVAFNVAVATAIPPTAPQGFAGGCSIPDRYDTSDSSLEIESADFDGTNGPDLAVAGGWDGTVAVLLNNGDGTFAPRTSYPTGALTSDVVVADFDGVNGPDIAALNDSSADFSVLLNNGDGTFAPEVRYAAGVQPVSLATADFDGANGPDLAVGDSAGVKVFFNDGAAGFGPAVVYTGGNLLTDTLLVVDLDSANGPDLVWSHLGGGFERFTVEIRHNDGAGGFGPMTRLIVDSPANDTVVIDVDGVDGPDLVHLDYYYTSAVVFVNDGTGGLVHRADLGISAVYVWGVTAADLDCTNGQDIIVAHDDGLSLFLSDGAGGFGPETLYGGHGKPRATVVADFDGVDGPDWAVADAAGYSANVSLNCLGLSCLTGIWLLRYDGITGIAPVTPPLAAVFASGPLLIENGHVRDFASGGTDPDAGVIDDGSRPLVLYQVTTAGNELRAVKTSARRVEIRY